MGFDQREDRTSFEFLLGLSSCWVQNKCMGLGLKQGDQTREATATIQAGGGEGLN